MYNMANISGVMGLMLYYCSTIPDMMRPLLRWRATRRGKRARGSRPPSYDSIHLGELPPHYEDVPLLNPSDAGPSGQQSRQNDDL